MMTRTLRILIVASLVVLTAIVTWAARVSAEPRYTEVEPVTTRSDCTTNIGATDQPAPVDPPSFSVSAATARGRGGPGSQRAMHATAYAPRSFSSYDSAPEEAKTRRWIEPVLPRRDLLDLRMRSQAGARARGLARLTPTAPARPFDAATSGADPETLPVLQSAEPVVPRLELDPSQISEVGVARWIDVDVTHQLLTAYEGSSPVRSISVSTGLPGTPTPVGQYRVWVKLRYDDMEGPGYYLADVPYTMYFHGPYGLHGTYWHSNFGHPMSHGCVNLPTPEAEWLFAWADVGTVVYVHN